MSSISARKLLQEQLKHNTTSKLINSPHAKYDSKGQLRCIVCGVPVKSAIIWQAHIAKKSHIQNLANLELKQKQLNSAALGVKRKSTQPTSAPPSKKLAVSSSESPSKPKGILKGLSSYSSSDSEDEDLKPHNAQNLDAKGLPPGFFDSSNGTNSETEVVKKEELSDEEEPMSVDDEYNPSVYYKEQKVSKPQAAKPNTAENLPEGFFDDPVQDAKVRKVEYIDKDEEEWSAFMREVSMAETTSKAIIDEDAEQAAKRNQIQDVEEAIELNKKVIDLDRAMKSRQFPAASETTTVENRAEDTSDSEDDNIDSSSMNWRAKGFL